MATESGPKKSVEELYEQALSEAKRLRAKADQIEERAKSFRQDALEFAKIGRSESASSTEDEKREQVKAKIIKIAMKLYDENDTGQFLSGELRQAFRDRFPNTWKSNEMDDQPWWAFVEELITDERLALVERRRGRHGSLLTLGPVHLESDTDDA